MPQILKFGVTLKSLGQRDNSTKQKKKKHYNFLISYQLKALSKRGFV